MTRKIIYMALIISGSFILTSRSCVPYAADEESTLKTEQDSILKEIKNEFEAEYLLEDRLLVYGERAKQKILDLADYLCLYSDKTMDTAFKHQVKDMIYRLFYDEEATVQLAVGPGGSAEDIKHDLSDLLYNIDASKYQSIEFKASELKTIEPLHLQSVEWYSGKLVCGFMVSGITENDTVVLNERPYQVNIITTLTKKQFGTDTTSIWQVFLDEIIPADTN
ncbi:MAG: hypothetical protein JXB19_01700 [Bacteroidales bacterium]|nr:hypothetical protein [Bacteroidales bacterium]